MPTYDPLEPRTNKSVYAFAAAIRDKIDALLRSDFATGQGFSRLQLWQTATVTAGAEGLFLGDTTGAQWNVRVDTSRNLNVDRFNSGAWTGRVVSLDRATGNVGIGLAGTPATRLHVAGSARLDGATPELQVALSNGSTGGLRFQNASGTSHWLISETLGAAGEQGGLGFRDSTRTFDSLSLQAGTGCAAFGGGNFSQGRLDVLGSMSTFLSGVVPYNMLAFDNAATAAGTGGGLAFGFFANSGVGSVGLAGVIKGSKTNATVGNAAGQLEFWTCDGTALRQSLLLDSAGLMTINPNFVDRTAVLQVNTTQASTTQNAELRLNRLGTFPAREFWAFRAVNGGKLELAYSGNSSVAATTFLEVKGGGTLQNIGLFGAGSYGGGDGMLFITNRNVAPTTNPAGGLLIYAEAGAGKARGASGTVTTFAPADPHCPQCGADFSTEHYNPAYGYVSICFFCLADQLGDQPFIVRHQLDEHREEVTNRKASDVAAAKTKRLEEARELVRHARKEDARTQGER